MSLLNQFLNGLSSTKPILPQDLIPWGKWSPPQKNLKCPDCSTVHDFVLDTMRHPSLYYRVTDRADWVIIVFTATPIYAVTLIASVVVRFFRLLFLCNFRDHNGSFSFTKKNFSKVFFDLLKIPSVPFALIAFQFAALYGIISPNNGYKCLATLERGMFGVGIVLAQPHPENQMQSGAVSNNLANASAH